VTVHGTVGNLQSARLMQVARAAVRVPAVPHAPHVALVEVLPVAMANRIELRVLW